MFFLGPAPKGSGCPRLAGLLGPPLRYGLPCRAPVPIPQARI